MKKINELEQVKLLNLYTLCLKKLHRLVLVFGIFVFSSIASASDPIIGIVIGINDVNNTINTTEPIGLYGNGVTTNNGNIEMWSNNSYAIYSEGISSENYGNISTFGDNSYGIYELGDSATNQGDISIFGNNSYGIYGTYFIDNLSNSTITMYGDNSYAMYVDNPYAPYGNQPVNWGTLIAYGNNSYGMYGGKVFNFGTITMYGDNSYGIFSNTEVTNYLESNITVYGNNSYGIYGSSSAMIQNYGNIIVNGDNSYGIYGNGSGDITNQFGVINANGMNSVGMAGAGSGNVINTGKITVNGDNSYGIYGNGSGDITNQLSVINVNGINSVGMAGAGSGNVINTGKITASGDNSVGMKIISDESTGSNEGTIHATNNAIGVVVEGNNQFSNTGNITAEGTAILMSDGNNQLYVESSASGTGLIDAGLGQDTLVLGLYSSEGGTLEHDYINFDNIYVVSGNWTQTGNMYLTNQDATPNNVLLRDNTLGDYNIANNATVFVTVNASAVASAEVLEQNSTHVTHLADDGSNIGTITADTITIDGKIVYVVTPYENSVDESIQNIQIYNLFAASTLTGTENIEVSLPTPFGWNASSSVINETTGGFELVRDLPDSATNNTNGTDNNGNNGGNGGNGGNKGGGGNGIDLPDTFGKSFYEYPRNKVEQDLANLFRDKVYSYADLKLTNGWHQMGHIFGGLGNYNSNQVSGAITNYNADVPDVSYDYNTYGLFGVTQYNNDNLVLGINYGAAWSEVDYNDYAKSTESMTHYFTGLYGKYSPNRDWDIFAQIGYIYTEHELNRGVIENTGPFAGKRMEIIGDFNSQEFYAGLDIKYNIDLNSAWRISPFVGLSYAHIYEEGYNETPFNSEQLGHYGQGTGDRRMWYAMNVDSSNFDSLVSRLGVEGKYRGDKVTFTGSLAWEHEFLDRSADKNAYFLWQQDDYYRYNGVIDELKMNRDAAVISIGLDYPINDNLKFTISYRGEINLQADYNNHAGQIGLTYEF